MDHRDIRGPRARLSRERGLRGCSLLPSRLRCFAVITVDLWRRALVAALVARWIGPGADPLRVIALADFVATMVVFAASVPRDNSSVYDPYWSVAPIVIAAFLAARAGRGGLSGAARGRRPGHALGLRLTYNWARGFGGLAHEDWRYSISAAEDGPRLLDREPLGVHLMPTGMVYLGASRSLPRSRARARLASRRAGGRDHARRDRDRARRRRAAPRLPRERRAGRSWRRTLGLLPSPELFRRNGLRSSNCHRGASGRKGEDAPIRHGGARPPRRPRSVVCFPFGLPPLELRGWPRRDESHASMGPTGWCRPAPRFAPSRRWASCAAGSWIQGLAFTWRARETLRYGPTFTLEGSPHQPRGLARRARSTRRRGRGASSAIRPGSGAAPADSASPASTHRSSMAVAPRAPKTASSPPAATARPALGAMLEGNYGRRRRRRGLDDSAILP